MADTFKHPQYDRPWGYVDGQALIEFTGDCGICKQTATKRTLEANIIWRVRGGYSEKECWVGGRAFWVEKIAFTKAMR